MEVRAANVPERVGASDAWSQTSNPFLSTVEPDRQQTLAALAVLLGSFVFFLAVLPFSGIQLPEVRPFLPLYQSAYIIVSLLTASLLFGQLHILRAWGLLVLVGGYLFDALMGGVHILSFPGLFAPTGLLGVGPQATAWLYFLWHIGFSWFVIGYAVLKDGKRDSLPADRFGPVIALAIGAVIVLVCGLTLAVKVGHELLPEIMRGNLGAPSKLYVAVVTWLFGIAALIMLWRRKPRSLLDIWLMVVMGVWIFHIALSDVFNHGRFDVGWYAGRIYGLFAASLVLVVLLLENNRLYATLARMRSEERKRSTEQLQESETRFRATFEQAAVGIAHTSLDGRWLLLNNRFCEIVGYEREELMQHTFRDITHPDDLTADRTIMRHLLDDENQVLQTDKRYIHKNGSIVWAHLTVSVVRRSNGAPDYFLAVVEDIAKRKQAEAALQTMNEEMEDLTRFHVASQTISAIAHELNQPLSAITTYAEVAQNILHANNPDTGKLENALEKSAQQAQRAGAVLRELMAFLGKGEIQTEPVDLNNTLCAILARIESNSHGGFQVQQELDPGLPCVNVNRVQLEKVLINLIENGIDAMRGAGIDMPAIKVALCTDTDGNMAKLTVCDSGPGMDQKTLHHIFDPFFTTKPNGLGMGLAISRAIIQAHGGQLWAESEPGLGASFHISLPFVS